MEARDTETDLAVDFEPAGWCQEAEVGRFEWVCGWERDSTVVQAAGIWRGRGRTEESEMPFVKVRVRDWRGVEGRVRI